MEQVRRIRDQSREDLQNVLLPHQLTRLRQLNAQSQLKWRSLTDVLISEPLKSQLEITDRQADELKAAEQAIEEDLAREIAKLRAKARERLISKLKRAQRKQVDEIFGDEFEFSDPSTSKKRKNK